MHAGTFFAVVRCFCQQPPDLLQRRHANRNGRTMPRSNVFYLIVGALVVVVAVLGYYQYQDHNKKQTSGLSINLGPAGLNVGGGSK